MSSCTIALAFDNQKRSVPFAAFQNAQFMTLAKNLVKRVDLLQMFQMLGLFERGLSLQPPYSSTLSMNRIRVSSFIVVRVSINMIC